jgi:hypothetical protein
MKYDYRLDWEPLLHESNGMGKATGNEKDATLLFTHTGGKNGPPFHVFKSRSLAFIENRAFGRGGLSGEAFMRMV